MTTTKRTSSNAEPSPLRLRVLRFLPYAAALLLPTLVACSGAPLPSPQAGNAFDRSSAPAPHDGVVSAQSAEECASVCFGQAQCDSWQFQAKDGTCALQSRNANAAPQSQTAGVPRGGQ
jgi:hypothetical protein